MPIDLTKPRDERRIGSGVHAEPPEPTLRDKIRGGLRVIDDDGAGPDRIKELADFKNRPNQDWKNNPQAPWR